MQTQMYMLLLNNELVQDLLKNVWNFFFFWKGFDFPSANSKQEQLTTRKSNWDCNNTHTSNFKHICNLPSPFGFGYCLCFLHGNWQTMTKSQREAQVSSSNKTQNYRVFKQIGKHGGKKLRLFFANFWESFEWQSTCFFFSLTFLVLIEIDIVPLIYLIYSYLSTTFSKTKTKQKTWSQTTFMVEYCTLWPLLLRLLLCFSTSKVQKERKFQ